jgi:hypothetical protein
VVTTPFLNPRLCAYITTKIYTYTFIDNCEAMVTHAIKRISVHLDEGVHFEGLVLSPAVRVEPWDGDAAIVVAQARTNIHIADTATLGQETARGAGVDDQVWVQCLYRDVRREDGRARTHLVTLVHTYTLYGISHVQVTRHRIGFEKQ